MSNRRRRSTSREPHTWRFASLKRFWRQSRHGNEYRRQRWNLELIVATVVVTLLGAGGAWAWHRAQVNKVAAGFLSQADACQAQHDWRRASAYLSRYLRLRPDDSAILQRLAETFDRTAVGPRDKRLCATLHSHAVNAQPDNLSLRLRRAELNQESAQYHNALAEAEELLKLRPGEPRALRVQALAQFALARPNDVASVSQVAQSLLAAATVNASDIELVSLSGRVDRELARLTGEAAYIQRADETMDRLAEQLSDSPLAFLARGRYRQAYGLPGVAEDFEWAYHLAPDDPSVRADYADSCLARHEWTTAEGVFARMIADQPDEASGYLGMGRVAALQGDLTQAIDVWRDASSRLASPSPEISQALADAFIQQHRLDEAQREIDNYRRMIQEAFAVTGDVVQRRRGQAQAEFLVAKLTAVRMPRQALVAWRSTPTEDLSPQGQIELHERLAKAYVSSGFWDQAAAQYDAAHLLAPTDWRHLASAGQAWEAARHFDKALQRFQQVASLDSAPAEAWLSAARAALSQATVQANPESLLKVADDCLRQAEQAGARADLILVLRSRRAHLLGQFAETDEWLRQAATKYPASEEVHTARFSWLASQHLWDKAEQALNAWQQAVPESATALLARVALLGWRGQLDEGETLLVDSISRFPPESQVAVWQRLYAIRARRGAWPEAREALLQIRASQPANLQITLELVRVALSLGDTVEAQRWETELRQAEGDEGALWRVSCIWRLLSGNVAASATSAELEQLLDELCQLRPDWPTAHCLQARVAQRLGHREQAIVSYQRVMELGDRGPEIISALASLHYQRGDRARAESLLGSLDLSYAPDSWDRTTSGNEMTAGSVPVGKQLSAAKQDVMLSRQFLALGDRAAAETCIVRALSVADSDPEVRLAVVEFALRSDQPEFARKRLIDWEAAASPDAPSLLTLAAGWEMLGETQRASDLYRKAHRLAPKDVQVLRHRALFLASREPDTAEQLFREAWRQQSSSALDRRTLVQWLIQRGGPQRWREAEQIMAALGSNADEWPVDDVRLMAALLLRLPGRQSEATRLLQAVALRSRAATLQDGLAWVQLLEFQGDRAGALAAYEQLLARYPDEPVLLIGCAALRLNQRQDPTPLLERVERLRPENLQVVMLRARWLATSDRKAEVAPMLARYLDRPQSPTGHTSLRAIERAACAELLAELGDLKTAEAWLRDAAVDTTDLTPRLARLLARLGRGDAAWELYAHWMESQSADAVPDYCAFLLQHQLSTEAQQKSLNWLQQQAEQQASEPRLQLAVATLCQTWNRHESAISSYRRVLSLEPDHVLALNNLACLLAYDPKTRPEALRLAQRACQLAGWQAAFLDTQALIWLLQGEPRRARQVLAEVDAYPDTQAVPLFHLAVACQQSKEPAAAARHWQLALQRGFDASSVPAAEQSWIGALTPGAVPAVGP